MYGLMAQNLMCRLRKAAEISVEKIHHHVTRFGHSTGNLWRQGQCSIKGGAGDKELQVREFLHQKFPVRWIGKDGPIPWPPRSPDITSLDFVLWLDFVL